MLTDHIHSIFDEREPLPGLPELMRILIEQQRTSWPQLSKGYASLSSVKTREVRPKSYRVFLQFNPGRIVSTNARVDDASIRARQCFLCVENLPVEQQGILYKDDFLILCNPAPIFSGHFTISSIEHRPQEIRRSLPGFLELSRNLGPDYTVFYNGPKCGASAPDHLHFQAAPAGTIPIEGDATSAERRLPLGSLGSTNILLLNGIGREAVVIEGNDSSMIIEILHRFLDTLENTSSRPEEAMVNILARYDHDAWRLIVFPRRKHRPDLFFKEGSDRVMVSPAAVDMGGLIITPMEKDFTTLSPEVVDEIYQEVSLGREAIVESLRDFM